MMKSLLVTVFLVFRLNVTFAQPFNQTKLDSLFDRLDSNSRFMGSIAMAQNGRLIYSKSIGKAVIETDKPITEKTTFRVGSISKMFTAVLVFQAVEEKKIALTETLDTFFPAVDNAKKITIGNLLNHRSGIHNFTNDSLYLSYHTRPKTESELVQLIGDGKSDFEPNSKAAYSNSNYVLLTFILQKLYNKKYETLIKEKITQPLGLENTYVGGKIEPINNEAYSYSYNGNWQKENETDMSIPQGAGALVSNPTDLVAFIDHLFAGKLMSANSLNQMKTLTDNYGMGMFQIPFYNKKGFGHTGGIDGFTSVVYHFPADTLSIAITSNGQTYENNDLIIAGLSAYYNKPFTLPSFANLIKHTSELDPYLGAYSSPGFPLTITVTKNNLRLMAQATGQPSFPLEPIEKNRFTFKKAGIELEFLPAEKRMILKQGPGKYTLSKQ